jgi:hypothetical protein
MASSNNFDWSQYQIENSQDQQASPHQAGEDDSKEDFDWSQYEVEESLTQQEQTAKRMAIESQQASKLQKQIGFLRNPVESALQMVHEGESPLEMTKSLARMPVLAVGKVLPKLTQQAGGALELLSSIGQEGEPGQIKGMGTRAIRGAGEYLSKVGKEEETKFQENVEDIFGKSKSETEDLFTDFIGKWATLSSLNIPPMDAFLGASASTTAKSMGAPEWAQDLSEGVGVSVPSLAKGGKAAFNFIKNIKRNKNSAKLIANALKQNPKAAGKITGLAGTELEVFNALSDAEKASEVTKILEKQASILETASTEEQAALSAQEAIARENAPGPGFEAIQQTKQGATKDLQGRVTAGGEDIGVRPSSTGIRPTTTEANLESVLDKVHVNEIGNKRVAGSSLKNTIMEMDNVRYSKVNDLYNRSRELNSNINQPHIELASQLNNRLEQLQRIPRPSSVQRNLINALEDIIDELAVVEDGQIIGYKEVNNQTLIDQIQSLRQTVDFDFEHGSPKGIFKPTISDIQESVYNAAEKGSGEAAQALRDANTAYREWTTKYNNDYINPYRDRSNLDYEKLLDKNLQPDHFNVINDLVGDTRQGNEILGATKREIVDKKLKKFVEKPDLVRTRDFRRAMTDLESVLSPEQLSSVRSEMESQVPQRTRVEAKVKEKVTPEKYKPRNVEAEVKAATKEIKAAAKYSDKTPAEVRKLSNTPEGIAQLKTDLSKTKGGKDLFDKLAEQKINSIISQGKIKVKYTGNDLVKVLNNEKNYSLIEALTTPEEAKVALDAAQKLADKKFTWENLKGVAKGITKFKLLHWIIS